MQHLLLRNFTVLKGMSFFHMFLVIMPIFVPLMEQRGLDMTQIMLLQSVFGVMMLVFEVPSGYLADQWGRKQVLLLGYGLCGSGFTILLFADSFFWLVVFEACLGIGVSMRSGADIALMYESEQQLAEQGIPRARAGQHMSQLVTWMTLGEAAAALAASMMLLFGLHAVLWLQAIVGWAGFVIAWFLHEPDFHRMEQGHSQNIIRVMRHLLTSNKVLTLLVGISVLISLSTWLATWMYQKLWLEQQIPLLWFGYLWAGLYIAVSIGSRTAPGLTYRFGYQWMVIVTVLLVVFGFTGMALVTGLWVVLFAIPVQLSRGLASVTLRDQINQTFESSFRATGNSMLSFLFRILSITFGPLMGYSIVEFGVGKTIIAMAVFYLLVFVVMVLPWLKMSVVKMPG